MDWLATADIDRVVNGALGKALALSGTRAAALGKPELRSIAYVLLAEMCDEAPERLCPVCGRILDGRKARTCSAACRTRASREGISTAQAAAHHGAYYRWRPEHLEADASQALGYELAHQADAEWRRYGWAETAASHYMEALTPEDLEELMEGAVSGGILYYEFRNTPTQASLEGNGHRPPSENYYRQADRTLEGTL